MSLPSSLFALYRRGRRYRDSASTNENPEFEKSREERERFIAAALALCLRCEPGFRERFWLNVCRVSDDPACMPPVRADDILLEPPHWADLRLISDTPSGRYIWVIEIKTGAALSYKQNPTHAEFVKESSGYGWLLNQHEATLSRMRYIVLGAKEDLTLSSRHQQFPIWLRQATWEDVHRCRSAATETARDAGVLVDDLFSCLAAFHIDPFFMDNAKSIYVGTGLAGIGNAWTVLESVCQLIGAKFREKNLTVFPVESGSVFGVYVAHEGAPASSLKNFHLVCDSDKFPAWVGYFADADDKVTRSCWLIFNSIEKRNTLLPQVQQRFPLAEPAEDDYAKAAIDVKSSPGDAINDLDWFRSVLEFASGLKAYSQQG